MSVCSCPMMYTKGNLRLTSMMTQPIVEDYTDRQPYTLVPISISVVHS
jgi:hypothetical protein